MKASMPASLSFSPDPSFAASLGASIIVVEDSDEDFDTLVEAAHGVGLKRVIQRALSGADCLGLLRGEGGEGGEGGERSGAGRAAKAPMHVLPALIFMDLNSHGVDGREALVTIKNDPGLKKIPLVVLTTSSNPKDLTFCLQAGANAYHVKPVRYDHYQLLIRSILHYWLEIATTEKMKAGAN